MSNERFEEYVVFECFMEPHRVPALTANSSHLTCHNCNADAKCTFDGKYFDTHFENEYCNPGQNCPTWDPIYECRCNVEGVTQHVGIDVGFYYGDCPRCEAFMLAGGYGLAGGGIGTYFACDWCMYFHKTQDSE